MACGERRRNRRGGNSSRRGREPMGPHGALGHYGPTGYPSKGTPKLHEGRKDPRKRPEEDPRWGGRGSGGGRAAARGRLRAQTVGAAKRPGGAGTLAEVSCISIDITRKIG